MKFKRDNIINNYEITKLSFSYDFSQFDCGFEDLNDFIQNDALIQQSAKLNVTYAVIYQNKILAYFSILADNILFKNLGSEIEDLSEIGHYKTYPAVKIGRLAIDKKYQKLGLGNDILKQIIMNINFYSEKLGIRFITVDAYAYAFKFYVLKNMFSPFENELKNVVKIDKMIQREKTRTIALYKDLKKKELIERI
ncbi:MAG: N-acetyltransferase, partial [Methanobacteriaceae archaeon]